MGKMAEMDLARNEMMASFAGDIFGDDDDQTSLAQKNEPESEEDQYSLGEEDSDENDESYNVDDDAEDEGEDETDEEDDPLEDDEPDDEDEDDDDETESEKNQVSDKNAESAKANSDKNDNDPEAKEAARKAEWERKQSERKAEEARKLKEVQNMNSSEVTAASAGLVAQGVERLTRRNMKVEVGEHIKAKCMSDPVFARKVMHPRKSIVRCFQYINKKACDYLTEEKKLLGEDNNAAFTGGAAGMSVGGDVPDEMCYTWAVEYYETDNLDIDKEKDEKYKPGYVPKKASGKPATKTASATSKGKPKKETAKAVLAPSKTSILDDMLPLG